MITQPRGKREKNVIYEKKKKKKNPQKSMSWLQIALFLIALKLCINIKISDLAIILIFISYRQINSLTEMEINTLHRCECD